MVCATSVPRQKNGPRDGLRLCTLKLIDLAVLPHMFHFSLPRVPVLR